MMIDMQQPTVTIDIDGLDEIMKEFNKKVERIINTLSRTEIEKESRSSLAVVRDW